MYNEEDNKIKITRALWDLHMRERIRKHLSQNKNIMQKFLRILPFIHPHM